MFVLMVVIDSHCRKYLTRKLVVFHPVVFAVIEELKRNGTDNQFNQTSHSFTISLILAQRDTKAAVAEKSSRN